jgi:hypothetical protein
LTDAGIFELQSDDPKFTTDLAEFTLVVYKQDYFQDLSTFTTDTVLNKSVAFQKAVKVRLSNCIIKSLSFPVPGIEVNFIIGSDPITITHSSLKDANTCGYPI